MNILWLVAFAIVAYAEERCDLYEFCDLNQDKHIIYAKTFPEISSYGDEVRVSTNVSCPINVDFCPEICCRPNNDEVCVSNETEIKYIEEIINKTSILGQCHCYGVCVVSVVEDELWKYTIEPVVSVFFLTGVVVVYLYVERFRKLGDKIVLGYVCSLLGVYLFKLPVLIFLLVEGPFCVFAGYMLQFSLLSTFFWMNVTCLNLWSMFTNYSFLKIVNEGKRFVGYCCYCWGVPCIITMVTFLIDRSDIPWIKSNIGEQGCFIDGEEALFYYFYSFKTIILAMNLAMFVHMVIVWICRGNLPDGKKKMRFYYFLKLAVIMGICWFADVILFYHGASDGVWEVVYMVNCSQGILLFIAFVCTPKTVKLLKRKINGVGVLIAETTSNDTEICYNVAGKARYNNDGNVKVEVEVSGIGAVC